MNIVNAPSASKAAIRVQLSFCNTLVIAAVSSRATLEKDIVRYNGEEKTKTASRKIKMPHGRLLQVFCDLEGFDVDKLFIFEAVNQTDKTINKTLVGIMLRLKTRDLSRFIKKHSLKSTVLKNAAKNQLRLIAA